ncbi:1-acyl-sn-glycerol-3-phosphate acyltransferase [Spirillospora sp. CA-253888]
MKILPRSRWEHTVAAVLRDPATQRQVRAAADRMATAPEALEEQIVSHLRILVADHCTVAGRLLRSVAVLVYGRPEADPAVRAALVGLRRAARTRTLVFLPAHRSYADSLLLSVALHDADLPATYRLAGENLAFWPLSSIARRSGMIFIRRRFGNDLSYQLAVRVYLAYLLGRGAHLEWYSEGGRSRTGRLGRPRLGLLRELLAALDQAGVPEARIVPLTFSYALLPEARALVDEDRGAAKPSEDPWFLLKRLTVDRRARERPARLSLGTVFSAHDEAASSPGPGRWGAARALAARLRHEWGTATPLTGEALICLALAAGHRRPRGLDCLVRELRLLLEYAAHRSIPVAACEALTDAASLRPLIDRMCRAGVLTNAHRHDAPLYWIGRGQHHLAAYHRQTGAHWLVDRCVAELAVLADGDEWTALPLRMHALLDRVFLLPSESKFLDLVAGASSTLDLKAPSEEGARLLSRQPFLLAHRLLGAPLEAYLEAALRHRPPAGTEPDPPGSFPRTGSRRWPESRSKELRAAGLAAAAAAERCKDGSRPRSETYLGELRSLTDRLADIESLDDRPHPSFLEER